MPTVVSVAVIADKSRKANLGQSFPEEHIIRDMRLVIS